MNRTNGRLDEWDWKSSFAGPNGNGWSYRESRGSGNESCCTKVSDVALMRPTTGRIVGKKDAEDGGCSWPLMQVGKVSVDGAVSVD